jgi:hypothetical protein
VLTSRIEVAPKSKDEGLQIPALVVKPERVSTGK